MLSTSSLPAIGSPFEGGFYGGTIRIAAALFATAWAPKAEGETEGAWHPKKADVPAAMSTHDSWANTLALAEAGSQLAQWAMGLRIADHDDWCLPSRDVLELAYRHLKPTTYKTGGYFRDGDNPASVPAGFPYALAPITQTSVQAFQEGGAEAFEEAWYWSSSQYSAGGAWGQFFDDGFQTSLDKSYEARARAVRLIQLTA
jgi:hypothetical protein